jgi:hypothetical protein
MGNVVVRKPSANAFGRRNKVYWCKDMQGPTKSGKAKKTSWPVCSSVVEPFCEHSRVTDSATKRCIIL